jgi:D-glycero-D-manno-heptose 1,7-bisphosphate phosphatase
VTNRIPSRQWGRTIQACSLPPLTPASRVRQKAVFLDRDGTLIVDKPYNANPNEIELLPGAVEGLTVLRDAGYLLIVVTNQSGIARGYFDECALQSMHRRLSELLRPAGITIAAFYFCPHHVDGKVPTLARFCGCRKPSPGMILRAASDWSIDLRNSWLIGNSLSDAEAASAAGCNAILVGGGHHGSDYPRVDTVAEAARRITASDGHEPLREVAVRRAVHPG